MALPRLLRPALHVVTPALLIVLAGCGNEPTPEQRRADAALAEAKSSLARGGSMAARDQLLTALAVDEAIGRRQNVAEEAAALGSLAAAAASFDSAFGWYERALKEYKEVADRPGARAMTLATARLHRQMGDERKAFAAYTEALRLARVFDDDDGVLDFQWAMLPCARALDESEEEARILRDLMQEYSAAGDIAHQAAVLLESANGKFSNRAYDRAAEDFLRALMLADQARDSLLSVRAALRLAMTFEAAGKLRDALTSYGDCLKRADRTAGASDIRLEALIRVGNLYLRNRSFGEAARFFRAAAASARTMGNSIAAGYMLLQLGHCDLETSREAALRNYRGGFEALKSLGHPAGLAYAALCLGQLFQRNNQPTDALQYFKSSIEYGEPVTAPRDADDLYVSCEHAYLGARRTPAYDDAIEILLQLGRYDEAFWFADRRNGKELFGALSAMSVGVADDTLRAALDACAAARARHIGAQRQFVELAAAGGPRRDLLADVRAARERAFVDVADAAARVARSYRRLEAFVRIANVSIAEVQKTLPPGTALVQHILARRALYAFVVTSGRTSVQVAAFEKDRVFDLAREFDDLLRMREQFADSSRAQQSAIDQRLREVNAPLYEAFIRPIEGAIAGVPNIVVVLPRELPGLPLHALNRTLVRSGGTLAEQHTVSYLPSAGTLLLPRMTAGPVKQVVAIGYPGGTGWDVEYELRDIRAFYKDVRLYFDQQASRATLQRERGDLLHIAARFQFREERPGNSSFVLSDEASSDIMKRIPSGELLSMHPFNSVVVSDLDPGRSGIRPPEAYLFFAAGTQHLVFTSRAPSRKAKKIFGELFYTALLTGMHTRAAFHKAQLDMLKMPEYAPPHVWAPFFLWGR
jgi:CHAT domain-containing protein/tetratricopeptide (TPR) repeat protein